MKKTQINDLLWGFLKLGCYKLSASSTTFFLLQSDSRQHSILWVQIVTRGLSWQAYYYATPLQPSLPLLSSIWVKHVHKSEEQNHIPLKHNIQKQTLDKP